MYQGGAQLWRSASVRVVACLIRLQAQPRRIELLKVRPFLVASFLRACSCAGVAACDLQAFRSRWPFLCLCRFLRCFVLSGSSPSCPSGPSLGADGQAEREALRCVEVPLASHRRYAASGLALTGATPQTCHAVHLTIGLGYGSTSSWGSRLFSPVLCTQVDGGRGDPRALVVLLSGGTGAALSRVTNWLHGESAVRGPVGSATHTRICRYQLPMIRGYRSRGVPGSWASAAYTIAASICIWAWAGLSNALLSLSATPVSRTVE